MGQTEQGIANNGERLAFHDEPTWAEQLGLRMEALTEITSRLQNPVGLLPDDEEKLVHYYQGIEGEKEQLINFGRSRGWLA